jgi:hypothetical protein
MKASKQIVLPFPRSVFRCQICGLQAINMWESSLHIDDETCIVEGQYNPFEAVPGSSSRLRRCAVYKLRK